MDAILGAWPNLCCGCGAVPTTTYPAWVRRSGAGAIAVGLAGGGAHWTTYSLPLPACRSCTSRARWVPLAWAALCVVLFFAGLAAAKAGVRFEPDGTPIVGFVRAYRQGALGGFLFALLLGPPLFLVLQRRAAPALISDIEGSSWQDLASIELDCGSDEFALAVERHD
jgi:hypothetical protein